MTAPTWETAADLLVIGSGVAGLTAAARAAERGLRVLVVTKGQVDSAGTSWAQGGVAVVEDDADAGDSVHRHVDDTLAAGAGLCDAGAVREILSGGAGAIARLREAGAQFDSGAGRRALRTREGGHSAFRVVHAGGDATGAEVERTVVAAARDRGVAVLEQHIAVELDRGAGGAVTGALVLDEANNPGRVRAPSVLLATGGLGQLYAATTNPAVATADGLALALRAGARVRDVEFVQFHPTALALSATGGSLPLVTEAVRGEGAVLVDDAGCSVTAGVHPSGDLAPRDVVAAAITDRMAETGAAHVYLDATGSGGFAQRFPTVHAACRAAGIDPGVEPIPVTPAAHYSCGGVEATVDGRTSVPGLYAAGEVAGTGLHGANRLASNSLLEGLVTGQRAAEAIAEDVRACRVRTVSLVNDRVPAAPVADREVVRQLLTRHAGIGRDTAGLAAADRGIERAAVSRPLHTHRMVEDAALTLVARTLLYAARDRTESRGCHRRTDHPGRDDQRWRRSTRLRLDVAGQFMIVDGGPVRERAGLEGVA